VSSPTVTRGGGGRIGAPSPMRAYAVQKQGAGGIA